MKNKIESYYIIQVAEDRYVESYIKDKNSQEENIRITSIEKQAKHFHIKSSITFEDLIINRLLDLFKDAKLIHYELYREECKILYTE